MKELIIDCEFAGQIPPLTEEELRQLWQYVNVRSTRPRNYYKYVREKRGCKDHTVRKRRQTSEEAAPGVPYKSASRQSGCYLAA